MELVYKEHIIGKIKWRIEVAKRKFRRIEKIILTEKEWKLFEKELGFSAKEFIINGIKVERNKK